MALMPKESKRSNSKDVDMFQLLSETLEKQKQKRRKELLAPLNVQEFFAEGTITINKRTCRGLDCNLCVKACPTSALYWKAGDIGVTKELCIFCGACVLNCIVDDCIRISRKRADGETEVFSKPRDFMTLQHSIDAKKRLTRVLEVFPTYEDYVKCVRKRKRKKTRK
jgi:Fe-S-cluster-containing hydrogenase component 2